MSIEWGTKGGKEIKLGWAMPLDWSHINQHTHTSTLAMHKPDIDLLDTNQSGDIAEKREGQCEQALKDGCTHVVLLDGDMVYYPEVLIDMFKELDNGADLVGGLCYRGNPPYDPLIWHPTEDRKLMPFKDYKFGDVVDAGATGAACLLVKREVFEGMEQPWFRMQRITEVERKFLLLKKKTVTIRRGEDHYFTRNATKAGFKLRIITKYDIGHMREFQIDRHFWLIFGILNNLGGWEVIGELLKKTQDKEWVSRELGGKTINQKVVPLKGGTKVP